MVSNVRPRFGCPSILHRHFGFPSPNLHRYFFFFFFLLCFIFLMQIRNIFCFPFIGLHNWIPFSSLPRWQFSVLITIFPNFSSLFLQVLTYKNISCRKNCYSIIKGGQLFSTIWRIVKYLGYL